MSNNLHKIKKPAGSLRQASTNLLWHDQLFDDIAGDRPYLAVDRLIAHEGFGAGGLGQKPQNIFLVRSCVRPECGLASN